MAESLENRKGDVRDPAKRGGYGRLFLDAVAEVILKVSMFCFGFIWWTLRWTFAILIFIGVMFVAAYYVYNEALAGAPYVTVPDVVGKPYSEAFNLLAQNNLVVGEQTFVETDNERRENYIVHQRPAAGKVVRAGRTVSLSVNRVLTTTSPNLVGMTREQAEITLKGQSLRLDPSFARVVSSAPVDTVIGQDPDADVPVARGALFHLLLSNGPGKQSVTVYMPDLFGMSPEEAAHELAPLNIVARPLKVEGTEPPFDEVIGQRPPPGTLLKPGQEVIYEVRTNAPMMNAWRRVTVVYTMPPSWMERELRMDVIYKDGTRKTLFPPLEYYVDGLPPKYEAGTTIRQPVNFQDELTVEIYLDGELARSYYYEGDADPVVRDFDSAAGELSSAGA